MAAKPSTGYGSKNPWFRMNAMSRAVGVVLIMVGGVWFFQGIGIAQGSVMTGQSFWAVVGAILVIAGVVLLYRAHGAAKRLIADEEAAAQDADPE
jgi:hypothetical protein